MISSMLPNIAFCPYVTTGHARTHMDIRVRVIAACCMHAVYEYRAHHDRKHIVAAHSENSRLRELLRLSI